MVVLSWLTVMKKETELLLFLVSKLGFDVCNSATLLPKGDGSLWVQIMFEIFQQSGGIDGLEVISRKPCF